MEFINDKIAKVIMDDMSDENTVKFQSMMDDMTDEETEVLKDVAVHTACAAYAIGVKDVIVKEVKALALIGCGALVVMMAKKIFNQN